MITVFIPPREGRPILVATNILVDSENRVLMGLRKDCDLWEFPGGKVEAESVIEAGRREMLEETGMTLLGNPDFITMVDGWEKWGVRGEPWYVGVGLLWTEWQGHPELVEGKHHEWRWWPITSLPHPEECTFGTRGFIDWFMGKQRALDNPPKCLF